MAIPSSSSARRKPDPPSTQQSVAVSAGPPRMTPLRELQLVELYRQGGPNAQQAIAELLDAYQRRIYSVCHRLVKNHDDACDLTQDSLLKMIENLDSYDGRSKLSTWAIRVAMNCCLSHLRKQKVRTHKALEESRVAGDRARRHADGIVTGSTAAGASRGEPSPAEGVERQQTRSQVVQALDALDPETRALLVLRDMQDLDYQQLAEVLEVPVGTVKSRLFRARAALRSAIEARQGE